MPTALFVCYGGGHAQMVIPLIRELGRAPGWRTKVLAATTAGPELARQGIPAFGYAHLLRPGDDAALAQGRALLAGSHDPASGISIEESTAYLGLCYQDLVDRHGPAEAQARLERYGRHAFLPLGPLRRAVDETRPDIVISTNSPKSERAALIVAHEMGIPAMYIEDLLGVHRGAHLAIVPAPTADVFCVGSTVAAENLSALHGIPMDRFRVTGNPAFDRLAALGAPERERGRRALGAANGERVVTYLDAGGTPPMQIAALADAVRSGGAAPLVVRRHPNDRSTPSADYAAAIGADVRVGDALPLDDLLMGSDVVLGVASTTLVEAMLLGLPVVQLGAGTGVPAPVGARPEDLPLFEHGGAVLVNDHRTLSRVVAAPPPANAAGIFVRPGTATRAIVTEINTLARA